MGVIDVAYSVWNWTKRVVKASTVATATGFGYIVGSGGALIFDSYHYMSNGIFHLDMANFYQQFFDNASTVFRHSNEVGGELAALTALGATLSLYKIRRR